MGLHARQLRTVPYVTASWGFPGGGHFIQPLHGPRPPPPPPRRARGRRRLRLGLGLRRRLRLQAARRRRRLLTKWRRPWKRRQPHFVPGRACQQNADLAEAEGTEGGGFARVTARREESGGFSPPSRRREETFLPSVRGGGRAGREERGDASSQRVSGCLSPELRRGGGEGKGGVEKGREGKRRQAAASALPAPAPGLSSPPSEGSGGCGSTARPGGGCPGGRRCWRRSPGGGDRARGILANLY